MSSHRFASAFAVAGDWERALDQALRQLPRLQLADANLGFVYFSDQFSGAINNILARLRRATGVQDWVGSSTVGVLADRGAALDAPGISLMLCSFPAGSFRVFSGRKPLPRDFGAYGAVVHADPHTPDMSDLVQDMASKIRADGLSGGLASARGTAWQVAGDALTGGLSGAAFDKQVRLITGVSQGCEPLPNSWRITRARDNQIEAINGRPALEVFREAIGSSLGTDLRRAVRHVSVGLTDTAEDRRLFAVRRIVGVDVQTGRLAINDNIAPGQHMLFVRQDERSARDDLANMLNELQDACPGQPRGAIYVSCLGRGGALFERDETEIEMIADVFGDMPLAGFFAAGEIVGSRLFGFTGALTLFM
ncbi:MAG TPA: FIST N-terminal domain-containing protein [Rhodocyclaceae bacterium]|nr:FIST N-terminal domain-containing protein [Rhodocyclaceae bacterium]